MVSFPGASLVSFFIFFYCERCKGIETGKGGSEGWKGRWMDRKEKGRESKRDWKEGEKVNEERKEK